MEIEYNDILKASLCSFKFIALRTKSSCPTPIPASLYFTFSFYTFPEVQTETVYVKTAKQIEEGDLSLNESSIALNKQHFLVYKDLLKMMAGQKPSVEQIIERAIKQQFDINPVATKNYQEHVEFAQYLDSRQLKIDVWNGKTNVHFGTCSVSLSSLLRQGEASREVPVEQDIVDYDTKEPVATLSMLMTNDGRRINKADMPSKPALREKEREERAEQLPASAPSVEHHVSRHKKKIYSKPIEFKGLHATDVSESELERK